MGGVRRDALGTQRLGQLDQQQRVAAGGVAARTSERLVPADQLGPGSLAQRLRVQADGERIAHDLADQMRVGVPLERAHATDERHAQPIQPAHEVAQPAQRRLVAPLQIVDQQQQRRLLGEVDRQPVEPVQDRE